MVLDSVKLNSTMFIARVHESNFVNEIPYIERVAEEIGEYGNIVDYKTMKNGNIVSILFKLLKKNVDKEI